MIDTSGIPAFSQGLIYTVSKTLLFPEGGEFWNTTDLLVSPKPYGLTGQVYDVRKLNQ